MPQKTIDYLINRDNVVFYKKYEDGFFNDRNS